MSFLQRILNAACLATLRLMHWIMINGYLQPVLRKYLGMRIPHYLEIGFIDDDFLYSEESCLSFQGTSCQTYEIWLRRFHWRCRTVITAWLTRFLTWPTWWTSRASIASRRRTSAPIWRVSCNAVSRYSKLAGVVSRKLRSFLGEGERFLNRSEKAETMNVRRRVFNESVAWERWELVPSGVYVLARLKCSFIDVVNNVVAVVNISN